MARLSKTPQIRREVLREIADSRLNEANILAKQGFYGASVYLAGYAVECYLKYAICCRLEWEELFGTFTVHDLDGLLLYSGLEKKLRKDARVAESFRKICSVWTMEGELSIRYRRPNEFTSDQAEGFLSYLIHPSAGVITWLRSNVH